VPDPALVSLRAIIDALGFQSDELSAYVERATGRLLVVSQEAIQAAEDGDAALAPGGQDELADAQAILRTPEHYVALPDRFEIDEYVMMADFAANADPASVRQRLQHSLRGRGAFRRFKDVAGDLGLLDRWYEYRDGRYEALARSWCEEHGFVVAAPAADA
jgi:hypothetical protein